jgi:NADPH2:quinone reductase
MKAYRVHEYGDAAKFIEDEVNKPSAKQGHVVVEVKASSLNPIDHKLLKSDLGINPALPGILHMDVAGVIKRVTRFTVVLEGYKGKQEILKVH